MTPRESSPGDPGSSALLTDLYELAMLDVYHRHRMLETAVFEFFVRRLPAHRSFLVAECIDRPPQPIVRGIDHGFAMLQHRLAAKPDR